MANLKPILLNLLLVIMAIGTLRMSFDAEITYQKQAN